MTKDAVAGRIRRLLAMADKRAADQGIPDTESAVTPEMLARSGPVTPTERLLLRSWSVGTIPFGFDKWAAWRIAEISLSIKNARIGPVEMSMLTSAEIVDNGSPMAADCVAAASWQAPEGIPAECAGVAPEMPLTKGLERARKPSFDQRLRPLNRKLFGTGHFAVALQAPVPARRVWVDQPHFWCPVNSCHQFGQICVRLVTEQVAFRNRKRDQSGALPGDAPTCSDIAPGVFPQGRRHRV